MKRRPLKAAKAWFVSDHSDIGEDRVFGYREGAEAYHFDLVQGAIDGGMGEHEAEGMAEIIALVFHDPQKEGELRRLRSVVKQVAYVTPVSSLEVARLVTTAITLMSLETGKRKKR